MSTRDQDAARFIDKLQHKIVLGRDTRGKAWCIIHDDALARPDIKTYLKMARHVLNDHYHRVSGFNCPLRDDGTAELQLSAIEIDLVDWVVIGTDGSPTSLRLFVPDETAAMTGFGEYLEVLISTLDNSIMSRWFK